MCLLADLPLLAEVEQQGALVLSHVDVVQTATPDQERLLEDSHVDWRWVFRLNARATLRSRRHLVCVRCHVPISLPHREYLSSDRCLCSLLCRR
jgi:hypothetical protein